MNEILVNYIKEKIFGYITGEISMPELYRWVKDRKEFEDALPYIKEESDIVFFLINKAGLETRNFYTKEKLIITKAGIVKNLKRYLNREIGACDLYNWADDVWNWELVEGYENEVIASLIEHLAADAERLNELTQLDYENIIFQVEKTADTELAVSRFNLIFNLPSIKKVLSGPLDVKGKIEKLSGLKRFFAEERFFILLLRSLKTLLDKNSSLEDLNEFFDKVSKGASCQDSQELIKKPSTH